MFKNSTFVKNKNKCPLIALYLLDKTDLKKKKKEQEKKSAWPLVTTFIFYIHIIEKEGRKRQWP